MAKKGARKSGSGRHHKGGKKNRKWGRMKDWCAAYRARGQREINKARRAARHAKRMGYGSQELRASRIRVADEREWQRDVEGSVRGGGGEAGSPATGAPIPAGGYVVALGQRAEAGRVHGHQP